MALLKQETMFDKRIVARNLKRNKINRKDYEAYLKGLKDVKDKAVQVFHEGSKGASGQ